MEPKDARVVLVVDQTDLERFEYDERGAELLMNEQVGVVGFPVEKHNEVTRNLEARNLLDPGNMLVQSPYDPAVYAMAENATQQFAVEKHFAFLTFCAHLGATEVVVEQLEVTEETRRTLVDMKARHAVASGEVNVERELYEQLMNKLTVHDRYSGGEPDFDAAERLLDAKRLRGDSNLTSLLDIRRSSNRLESRTVTLSLSDESRRNLSIAANLTVPAYVTFDAAVKHAVTRKLEYRLTLKVTF